MIPAPILAPRRVLPGLGAAVLLAVAWRAVQVLPFPVGTGETRASPDGRHEAVVMDWTDEGFWGGSRSWFSYEVRGAGGGRVLERFTSDRLDSPYFGSRSGHRVIDWAPDSRSVRFVFTRVTVTVAVEPWAGREP